MAATIIVPLDGSESAERALPVAGLIARRVAGSTVLVASREAGMPHDLEEYLVHQAKRFGLHGKHAAFETGGAAEAISTVVTNHADPLIVMSSRGPRAIDEMIVGSVTSEVLHRVDCPLLLLGPHVGHSEGLPDAAPEYSTLLLCVDGSTTAEAAVAVARRWAADLNLTAWVIQVLEPSKGSKGQKGDLLSHEFVNEAAYVARTAQGFERAGIETGYDVLHDSHPAAAIVRKAEELPNPIIAMATHGRTGLSRITMGSVAMAVVRHATCPVLVIRPTELAQEG